MMGEIRALTSLRGLAAFYVVLLHYSTALQSHCNVTIPALAPRGHLAVDFFFVLSGFIMAYTYAADFQQRGLIEPLPEFLWKRAARLLPLHWFMTAAVLAYTLIVSPTFTGAPLPAFNSDQPLVDVALNVLLLQGVLQTPNMNGPSWSISVEMVAYLAFPLYVALLFNRRPIVRRLSVALAVLALCVVAMQSPRLGMSTLDMPVAWTLVRAFAEFALGIAAFRVYARHRLDPPAHAGSVLWVAIAVTVVMMLGRLWDLVAVLMFPVIVVGVAWDRGAAARWLGHPVFYFMGVVSFSLYLTHHPIAYLQLGALKSMHPAPFDGGVALLLAAIGALSTIPLAWATYHLVEAPGRSAIRLLSAGFRRQKQGARQPG